MQQLAIQLGIIFFVVNLICSSLAAGQENLRVLRSNSTTVTVIDGDHVKKDYWVLMPEKNPDVYYVEIPMKQHTVTFRSEIDELSFPITFGERIDFVILLDGKISCPTQIRAEFRKPQPYSREEPALATGKVEIPFALGDNDKIYVTGRLNDGPELNFQFDLGCGGSVIKKNSVALDRMTFDDTITLSNSDGVNKVPFSSDNHLEIAGLHWRHLPFAVADNMTYRDEGLLGNTLFQDKVLEINYDRRVLVVHDASPPISPSFSRHAIVLDGVVPFLRGSLTLGNERRTGWFMFDTGAYTSILYSDQASPWNKLLIELRNAVWRGGDWSGPRLSIGAHSFSNFNYTIRNGPANDDQLGLLGNDILKRFNVILDNQNGFIYLQSNTLASVPYANPEYYLARLMAAVAVVVVFAGGWVTLRRRRKREG